PVRAGPGPRVPLPGWWWRSFAIPRRPHPLALPAGTGEVMPAGSGGWGPARGGLQDSWEHLLGGLGERVLLGGEVGVPRLRVPDLQPGVRADHDAVALQPGVSAQGGRDGDPALLVGQLVRSAGEEDPAVVPDRLGRHRRGAQGLSDAGELLLRKDVQAALLPLGDHDSPSELFSVLRGQDQPALLVKPGGVSTEEHGCSPPTAYPPPCSTVPHISPPSTLETP